MHHTTLYRVTEEIYKQNMRETIRVVVLQSMTGLLINK